MWQEMAIQSIAEADCLERLMIISQDLYSFGAPRRFVIYLVKIQIILPWGCNQPQDVLTKLWFANRFLQTLLQLQSCVTRIVVSKSFLIRMLTKSLFDQQGVAVWMYSVHTKFVSHLLFCDSPLYRHISTPLQPVSLLCLDCSRTQYQL